MTESEAFDELAFYTLSHGDTVFIHQYAVDAFAAQNADASTKTIKVAFALAGLCLHLERGFTGRAVQQAHMDLVKFKDRLPTFDLPEKRGTMRVSQVLAVPPGPARDAAITDWSAQIWDAWAASHAQVREWIKRDLG
jgi:hypothetical protein